MRRVWFLRDYQPFHSEFQIKYLILARSGGTLYGCYKQALREIASRLSSLVHSRSQIRLEHISEDRKFAENLDQVILNDSIRELGIFYAYARICKSKLGELTSEKISKLEADYWEHQLRVSIARDYLAVGSVTEKTIELLHVMPRDRRRSITNTLSCPVARDELINWYLEYEVELPSPSESCIVEAVSEISGYVYGIEGYECTSSEKNERLTVRTPYFA